MFISILPSSSSYLCLLQLVVIISHRLHKDFLAVITTHSRLRRSLQFDCLNIGSLASSVRVGLDEHRLEYSLDSPCDLLLPFHLIQFTKRCRVPIITVSRWMSQVPLSCQAAAFRPALRACTPRRFFFAWIFFRHFQKLTKIATNCHASRDFKLSRVGLISTHFVFYSSNSS